jgi:hypothetical protein
MSKGIRKPSATPRCLTEAEDAEAQAHENDQYILNWIERHGRGNATPPAADEAPVPAAPAAPPAASASATEYLPESVSPTTDKEWAEAKFKLPTVFLGDWVFHSQTIGMFTMRTDSGKTNWTVGLGLALAYGRTFCDWSPVNPARVLYIEGETPEYRMQDTIRTQRKALGIRDEEVSHNFSLITKQTHGDIPWLFLPQKSTARSDDLKREQEERRGVVWLDEQIKNFAGENPDDVTQRIADMNQEFGNVDSLEVIPYAGRESADCAINELIMEGKDIALTIIDTSTAYFAGDDENANKQALERNKEMPQID